MAKLNIIGIISSIVIGGGAITGGVVAYNNLNERLKETQKEIIYIESKEYQSNNLDYIDGKIAELEKKIAELEKNATELKSSNTSLKSEITTLKNELATAKSDLNNLTDSTKNAIYLSSCLLTEKYYLTGAIGSNIDRPLNKYLRKEC